MPSSYTTNNGLTKPATGELSGTWGDTVNNGITDLVDVALDGYVSLTLSGTSSTIDIPDGTTTSGDGRYRLLICGGTLAANHTITVTPNDAQKWYCVYNNTSGGFSVIIKQGSGSGTTVTIAAGYWSMVRLDGTGTNANVTRILDSFEVATAIKAATVTSASTLTVKPGADSTQALRFQTSGGTQVFGVDTTNSRLAVGTVAPSCKFEINGNSVAVSAPNTADVHQIGTNSGTGARYLIDGFTAGGQFVGRLAQGTAASPTAALQFNYLTTMEGRGYLTTGYSGSVGRIAFYAEENFTDSTAATAIAFEVTPSGSVSSSAQMVLNGKGGLELRTTTGALLLPRLTTTQRDALTPTNGMLIYNSTTGKFQGYESGAWVNLV